MERSRHVRLPPFQALVDAHASELHRFLAGYVGPDDAEDCLQDTLVAALRAYPGLAHGENLRAWLYTIARRKATDLARSRARRPSEPMERLAPAAEPSVGPAGSRPSRSRVGRRARRRSASVALRRAIVYSQARRLSA